MATGSAGRVFRGGAVFFLGVALLACVSAGQDLTLSREQFVMLVLQQNQRLVLQDIEREISEYGVAAEKGIFEPVFAVSMKQDYGERENNAEQKQSFLFAAQRIYYIHENTLSSAGVSGMLPLGTKYRISVTSNRLRNTVNTPEMASEYSSFAGIELTQPLLKRFGTDVIRAPIEIAEKEVQIKYQHLRRQLIESVNKAEAAYWNLVLADRRLDMRRQSLARAQQLTADIEERVAAGKASELEVVQARTGLMLRQAQMEEAAQGVVEAVDTMRALLSESAIEAVGTIRPQDSLTFVSVPTSKPASMERALAFHPDVQVNRLQTDQEGIRAKVAENERLPELNLVSSYGVNAYALDPDKIWEDYATRNYETWYVGMEFRMGLGGNVTARNQLRAAQARRRQFSILHEHLLAEIGSSINTLVARIGNLENRISMIDAVVALNRRLVDTATVWLKEGKGNIRSVLELEEDLVDAQDRHLASVADHVGALLQLETLEGTLLVNRKIDVEMYRAP